MFHLPRHHIKNILTPLLFLLVLSACASTSKLAAFVDKNSLTEFETLTYTVVYQGYADKYDIDFQNLNADYLFFFEVIDIDHHIKDTVTNNKTTYVTTWDVSLIVATDWPRDESVTIPSLTLNELQTPPINITVKNSPQPDWIEWLEYSYKKEVAVDERVTVKAKVKINDLDKFDVHRNFDYVIPAGDYDHVFIDLEYNDGLSYEIYDDNIIETSLSFYFDEPGKYTLSPFNTYSIKRQETPIKAYGFNAPKFTIQVK